MKTKLFAMALVGLFTINGAMAQEQGDVRAGLGLVIGTKSGVDSDGEKAGVGISPSVEYIFTDAISGSASYDWYFKSSVGGTDISISSFNIDGRYYFVTGSTQVYGLVGVGFLKSKVEAGGVKISDSDTGLNIGGGAIFGLSDTMGVNTQLKWQTAGKDGQLAATVGLVYTF